MKPKLVIISDLWGFPNDWTSFYTDALAEYFGEITKLDSRELAGIPTELTDEQAIHERFVNGGIEKAVKNLQHKIDADSVVLGFSIGGLIAWKAALDGLSPKHIFAVSSTRLRLETQKPPANIHLFFGALDAFKPKEEWFSSLNLTQILFENEPHDLYKNKYLAEKICQYIKVAVKDE